MRAERYRQIWRLLKERRGISLTELMSRLEVSRSTIFRDIAFLRDRSGAPIVFDREQGRYYLEPEVGSVELPGLWFSADETHALLSMQQLLSGLDSSGLLGEHIQPLRQRLIRLLGIGGDSADAMLQRIHIIAAAARPCNASFFQTLAGALLARRQLDICYQARSSLQTTRRIVSPQRLVHYRDNWYLDAWCHTRQALRSFAVDAIESAKRLDMPSLEIDEAELDRQLAAGYGIFAGSDVRWARLRFSSQRARWVALENWHPDQEGQWLSDGSYELRLPYSAEPELLMDILKYGPDCEVVEPIELRQRVVGLLEAAREKYRGVAGFGTGRK